MSSSSPLDFDVLRSLEATAVRHALAVFPQEAVGFVRAGVYYQLENVHSNPTEGFDVAAAAQRDLIAGGVDAIFHSHTNGYDCPTAEDMRSQQSMAVPWSIIVFRPPRQDERQPVHVETFWFGDQAPMDPYIGRKWRHGVNDCFTLCRDWWRKERGVVFKNPPRDDGWWNTDIDLVGTELLRDKFVRVSESEVKEGTGVLMSIGPMLGKQKINHIGIYLPTGRMLHHLANKLSKIDPLAMWRHFIVGYADWRD